MDWTEVVILCLVYGCWVLIFYWAVSLFQWIRGVGRDIRRIADALEDKPSGNKP